MIKRFAILYVICSIDLANVFSQNLVPNSDFEYYTSCPPPILIPSQVPKAYPWYDPTGSSSDYFHTCCGCPQFLGVPNNFWGEQNTKTGNGYCGFWAYGGWANPSVREYIAVRLLDSLVKDKKYCVSFYVSLAGPSIYGVDAIGMYLSTDSIYGSTSSWLPYTPQVINQGNIIMDTLNWVVIQDTFIAAGGEKFIAIGNFYDNANTNVDSTTTTAQPGGSYYYIEDVSVYYCDSTPQPPPPLPDDSVIYVPNAFSPNGDGENDMFFVQGGLDELHCSIFNRWGEQVAQIDLPKQGWDGRVNGLECNTGVYFYYLTAKDKNGKEITKKGNISLVR